MKIQKNKIVLFISILLLFLLACSCSNKEKMLQANIEANCFYSELDDYIDFDDLGVKTSYKPAIIECKEDAEEIVSMVIKKEQEKGFFSDYKLQEMNYYSKSEVWVAIYYRDNKNEHKQTVEISPTCSIAIQNTGEVLGIWVNE